MSVVGSIMMWAGSRNRVPIGWLYCDGSIVQQSQFPDLFKAIGHTFGQQPASSGYDPTTQFFLPDFRGYFLRGADDGAGRDPDAASRVDMQDPSLAYSGIGSVQNDEFRAHAHDYNNFPGARGGIASGTYWESAPAQTGTAGGKETRPINAYIHYLIRAQ